MKYHSCKRCSSKAIWKYAPSDSEGYYCDNHVPRGCSCNLDFDSNIEYTDDSGRFLPCCEYDYEINGFDLLPEKYDEEYFDD